MIAGTVELPDTLASAEDTLVASFRDPAGRLFVDGERVLRVVYPDAVPTLECFLNSELARRMLDEGNLVRSAILAAAEILSSPHPIRRVLPSCPPGSVVVEHERLPFPSYPFEWPPDMLHAAASLTISLAKDVLSEGLGLKDATPYNILFRGPTPVFIDVLSFERRDAGDPTWLPYAQFVRTFLLPLLASKHLGMALGQVFLTHRDGLEVEEVYRWLGPLRKVRPPFLSLVSVPAWLGARRSPDDSRIYAKQVLENPEKARFILESLLGSLQRALRTLAPVTNGKSPWCDYMTTNSYPQQEFAAKEEFIREALAEFAPKTVLDVGSNTGHFSFMAARTGAAVVAIDYDPVVVGTVWRQARSEGLNILPLVVNLARPTPAVGWRNRECNSFLDRAKGRFDAVLMLAVIHHMIVSERIPVLDILKLAAELTRDVLIIEYVGPEDSMFVRLTRGRGELHKDLTPETFEAACRRYFTIARTHRKESSHRRLYLLRKKRS